MPYAKIDGGVLHYEIIGEGAPLVMLLPQTRGPVGHGNLLDTLARQHTVITYDQRGTGGSPAAVPSRSMAAQASDVIALLDVLGLDQVSLLCHSTGCGIGLSASASHPNRVDALMLVAPWTHADTHLTTMQNLRITLAHVLEPRPYAQFNAALLYPPEYRRANEAGFGRLAADALARPHDATEIARRLRAILQFDARPLLPAIAARTLLVAAQDDQLMPLWFAAEAAEAISDSELVELDGGGHMLLETRSAEIAEMVLRFMAR